LKSLCEASCRGLYVVSTQESAEGRNNQSIGAAKGLLSRTTNDQPTMFVDVVWLRLVLRIISGAAPAPRRCNESPIQPLSNNQTIKHSPTLRLSGPFNHAAPPRTDEVFNGCLPAEEIRQAHSPSRQEEESPSWIIIDVADFPWPYRGSEVWDLLRNHR
jgi:hypothetical protein